MFEFMNTGTGRVVSFFIAIGIIWLIIWYISKRIKRNR